MNQNKTVNGSDITFKTLLEIKDRMDALPGVADRPDYVVEWDEGFMEYRNAPLLRIGASIYPKGCVIASAAFVEALPPAGKVSAGIMDGVVAGGYVMPDVVLGMALFICDENQREDIVLKLAPYLVLRRMRKRP